MISIIIPCYNDAPFIEKCLESVCGQTIVDQLQVVLVDDGSIDGSADIARRYLERQGRIKQTKIVRLSENKGVANARIVGIKESDGEYIMFFDADDWVDVTMCEKMLRKAQEEGCDVVVCDYNMVRDGIVQPVVPCYKEPFLQQLILCSVTGSLCNKLILSSLLKSPDFIYPTHDFSEDHAYCLQVAINTSRIGYVPEPFYNYRRRTDSLVRNQTPEMIQKRHDDDMENFRLEKAVLERYGLSEKYREEIIVRKLKTKNGYCNDRELWLKTFPELRKEIFKSSYISWRSRFSYLLKLIL